MKNTRSIKIAVTAMGGQGGGVLSGWLGKLGENNGYIVQTTSVPGVAQRTGATVYYVELFPKEAAQRAGKDPVLALMPVPGDVDLVIAAEFVEAGRAITRGFVTPETTLIASTHRDFAISEKIQMGDGRKNTDRILEAARKSSKNLIIADMADAAAKSGSVISSVLFGAVAGANALPFSREQFESQIKQMGRAVEGNLRGFALGYDLAQSQNAIGAGEPAHNQNAASASAVVAPLIKRLESVLPSSAQYYAREGLRRVVDYQDLAYGRQYLDHLKAVFEIDRAAGGETRDWKLTQETAKHLALWMSYDDAIRVADLKTRGTRFERIRDDVHAGDAQIFNVYEFMHPRVEEICDILPNWLAKTIHSSGLLKVVLHSVLGEGKRVPTTKLHGFLPLYFLSMLRTMRRSSYRYAIEHKRIDVWMKKFASIASRNYLLAVEIVQLQRLLKGYGDTFERGLSNYTTIMENLPIFERNSDAVEALSVLKTAAMADEDGRALQQALEAVGQLDEKAA